MTNIKTWLLIVAVALIAIKPVHAKSKPSERKKTLQEYVNTHCKKSCINAKELRDTVKTMSRRHSVPSNLILAIVKVESRFKRTALSKGNYGLMQVNYSTHRTRNLMDTTTNLEVGTSILSDCLEKTKANLRRTLACYKGDDSPIYRNEINKAMLVLASLN